MSRVLLVYGSRRLPTLVLPRESVAVCVAMMNIRLCAAGERVRFAIEGGIQ